MRLDLLRNIVACFIVIMTLLGCGQQYHNVDHTYIVPDGYEGYLVVKFNCIGGVPIDLSSEMIEIAFADNGTACITNSLEGMSGEVFVVYESGAPIPIYPEHGHGYCCGYILADMHGRAFFVAWLGPVENGHSVEDETIDEFLLREFGSQ